MGISQIRSFFLPVIFLVIIPGILLFNFSTNKFEINFYLPFVGTLLCLAGLAILTFTVKMLTATGKKTVAPWDPSTVLVTSGMYSYTRNPMMGGAMLVLLGEAAIFGSPAILVWSLFFFMANDLYFYFVEEPALEKQFGQEYKEYKNKVPKWLPRAGSKKK